MFIQICCQQLNLCSSSVVSLTSTFGTFIGDRKSQVVSRKSQELEQTCDLRFATCKKYKQVITQQQCCIFNYATTYRIHQ